MLQNTKKEFDPMEVDACSPPVAPSAPFTPLVLSLMKELTLDEKMALIAGDYDPEATERVQAGYLPGVPRLGVPPRRDSDGDGLDMHGHGESTSFPSRIGIAATFDRAAAKAQGVIEGREAHAHGVDLLYAPQLDICRAPNFGRNNTTFGEDPYLSGQMGIGEVNGIQSQGVMAQIKHFIMYNGQQGVPFAWRPTLPTVVDDYTLHEIYLPPFEATIEQAQPSSVMGSYQMFRVTPQQMTPNWACGNPHTLLTILRNQLKFKGFVSSDYGATHATDELLNGLDQQYMDAKPSPLRNFGGPFFGADLRPYVDPNSSFYSLSYSQALDRAVANVLYQYERFGLMACASPSGPIDGALPIRPLPDKELGITTSLKLAEESAVLLKNEDNILPLSESVLRNGIAIIGPTGRQLMANGLDAERSSGYNDRVSISPLTALQQLTSSKSNIQFAPGIDWIGETIPCSNFKNGLTRTNSFNNDIQIDSNINFVCSQDFLSDTTYTWSGILDVPHTAIYYLWAQQSLPIPARFYGDLWGIPQTKIFIDGSELSLADIPVPVCTYPEGFLPNGGVNLGGCRLLQQGEHTVKISTYIPQDVHSPVTFRLAWSNFDETLSSAVELARHAEVSIVFVDDNGGPASVDTPTDLNQLAENQNQLVQSIVAANPNTIVVVTSGNLLEMPWFQKVKAVLEVWYPGQEGGTAIANLLLGKSNPSGRLPLTLPQKWEDTPFASHPERYLGKNNEVIFSDGVYVGYRWYDHQHIKPLLPFGFGLSYTTFEFSNMEITSTPQKGICVKFDVINTGKRLGTAIPQIYIGKPYNDASPYPRAEKALAQFTRITLCPNEKQSVSLEVAARAFEYWDVDAQEWTRSIGARNVFLATSSQDILLSKEVFITA